MTGCKMADDCLCLLTYVARHRQDSQTWGSLAEAANINVETLRHIIDYAIEEGESSLLAKIARKYAFSYKVNKNRSATRWRRQWIIDVVSRDHSDMMPIHGFIAENEEID